MTEHRLDMTGQKLETFLTERGKKIALQDEVREKIFSGLVSITLRFDRTKYASWAEFKEAMTEDFHTLGYSVHSVDEAVINGDQTYHFHVRRPQNA